MAVIESHASYYSGGDLPESNVTWKTTTSSATYCPPGLSRFTFKSVPFVKSSGYSR